MTSRTITTIDLTTGDIPVVTTRNETAQERRRNTRRPLGEITSREINQAINMGEPLSRTRRRRTRRVEMTEENKENAPPQEGSGQMKSGNAWIQHVKDFAKAKGIPYWKALKSPECKTSYKKHSKVSTGKGVNIGEVFRDLGKTIAKPFGSF